MIILGIETSCDETGVAICSDFKILSSYTKTQSIHQQFGGVVPEIASREHEKYLPRITKKVLKDANIKFKDIDAIAVTNGPGLMGSLLSGISFAKGISYGLDVPIIPINHLEAHLNSVFIEHEELEPPFINLLVSGGHTQLWLVKNMFEYELLGETLDDACGEAFDKGAKKLNLNYPGGPEIERLATSGDKNLINFPRPMIHDNSFNFSFSGLKTSLINCVNKDKYNFDDIAASYQEAIVDTLIAKFEKAMNQYSVKSGIICGGVAANKRLREKLDNLDKNIIYPSMKYCTDNADMIAYLAEHKFKKNKVDLSKDFSAYSRGMVL
ncbi:MAG: tRNA (adenosine(37)-N6)-threonylcarbamoyltransferase complex transferase subunit TsaD [Candidatus Marinimicrobia bacterium]|nr:tRNA (adenosine(37)-N6)-threonylcarbamoyltransferase complex transferase subunit TsaD [Candidatus Neomarinimicrobiota bacterium]